jgi:hypothetical protein
MLGQFNRIAFPRQRAPPMLELLQDRHGAESDADREEGVRQDTSDPESI